MNSSKALLMNLQNLPSGCKGLSEHELARDLADRKTPAATKKYLARWNKAISPILDKWTTQWKTLALSTVFETLCPEENPIPVAINLYGNSHSFFYNDDGYEKQTQLYVFFAEAVFSYAANKSVQHKSVQPLVDAFNNFFDLCGVDQKVCSTLALSYFSAVWEHVPLDMRTAQLPLLEPVLPPQRMLAIKIDCAFAQRNINTLLDLVKDNAVSEIVYRIGAVLGKADPCFGWEVLRNPSIYKVALANQNVFKSYTSALSNIVRNEPSLLEPVAQYIVKNDTDRNTLFKDTTRYLCGVPTDVANKPSENHSALTSWLRHTPEAVQNDIVKILVKNNCERCAPPQWLSNYGSECLQSARWNDVERLLASNVLEEFDGNQLNSFWTGLETEFPYLGRTLRTVFEKKIIGAAIETPSAHPIKRKM